MWIILQKHSTNYGFVVGYYTRPNGTQKYSTPIKLYCNFKKWTFVPPVYEELNRLYSEIEITNEN